MNVPKLRATVEANHAAWFEAEGREGGDGSGIVPAMRSLALFQGRHLHLQPDDWPQKVEAFKRR
jgi:hypothetical protein